MDGKVKQITSYAVMRTCFLIPRTSVGWYYIAYLFNVISILLSLWVSKMMLESYTFDNKPPSYYYISAFTLLRDSYHELEAGTLLFHNFSQLSCDSGITLLSQTMTCMNSPGASILPRRIGLALQAPSKGQLLLRLFVWHHMRKRSSLRSKKRLFPQVPAHLLTHR